MELSWCCLVTPLLRALPPVIIMLLILHFLRMKKRTLEGKHVLITGGSSGIGLAVAHIVARQGANVTIVARSVENLEKAQKDIEKTISSVGVKGMVQFYSADVTGNASKITSMVQGAEATLGPIFMLVNCAGYSKAAKFEDLSQADVQGMMDVNFMGSFLITQEVVRGIKRSGNKEGGIIVFTSSQGGLLGLYGFTAYAAAKGALVKMAEALHMEVKPYNISITVSVPPDTDTPGFANENLTKPTETALISASAGLFKAEQVAEKLVSDALSGRFYSTVGIEGFMLTTLCAGMGPITNILDFIYQVLLSGLFRLISAFYLWDFGKIVKREHEKRLGSKKME